MCSDHYDTQGDPLESGAWSLEPGAEPTEALQVTRKQALGVCDTHANRQLAVCCDSVVVIHLLDIRILVAIQHYWPTSCYCLQVCTHEKKHKDNLNFP